MRKIYILTLIFVAMGINILHGQISVLFVDDSDDNFGNAELFYSALDSVGYSETTYYNAVEEAVGPTDLYMNEFDLVIWFTSSEGTELLLWNGLDEDNASLKAYLNNGGRLWVVGSDFLFDRYGAAPVTFSEGDFPYDYLGLSSYDIQSYADDGSLGVPGMVADSSYSVEGFNDLTWIFQTLWYADGVSLVEEAESVYRMGDADYVFADSISGSYYDNGTFQVLSYFFDLSLVADFEILKENVAISMTFFSNVILNTKQTIEESVELSVYPNPTASQLNLEISLENKADVSVSLVDMTGKLIENLMSNQENLIGKNIFQFGLNPTLTSGYFYVKINIGESFILKPVVVQK